MPALLLLSGPSAGVRYNVVDQATLGRSPSCEIPLEDGKVSRRHARVEVSGGQARITDLGSRNGTIVNGEKIEGEAVLLPGDRVQVGDSVVLYEPPARASVADREPGEVDSFPLEEALPAVGSEAALYSAGMALLAATSQAMVLRRAAEELGRTVNAERAAALLGGTQGLLTAAVVGAETVEVPRALLRAALERRETARAGPLLCAPLAAAGGGPFGILFAERPEPFSKDDQKLAGALGRLAGEAFAQLAGNHQGQKPIVLVGGSRPFRKTVEQARRAAANSEPVVLFGEAGTGKLRTAEYIHSRSARALGPMVIVDCGRAPSAVEEELVGRSSQPGVPPLGSALLRADGGTLLLKRLDLLPKKASERLGKWLVQGRAPSLSGGDEPVQLRVLVTCSAPLSLSGPRSQLHPELLDVLRGIEIEVLPLRERRADVPALFDHFAGEHARLLHREPPTLSPEAARLLNDYAWPGNLEELRLIAERMAMLYPGVEVPALRLPPEVLDGNLSPRPKSLAEMVARLERDAIAEALREARGKKIRAAAILGISRPTLDKKIADYQLSIERGREE